MHISMRISFKISAVLRKIVDDHFGGGRRRKPGNEAIGKPSICSWTGIEEEPPKTLVLHANYYYYV